MESVFILLNIYVLVFASIKLCYIFIKKDWDFLLPCFISIILMLAAIAYPVQVFFIGSVLMFVIFWFQIREVSISGGLSEKEEKIIEDFKRRLNGESNHGK